MPLRRANPRTFGKGGYPLRPQGAEPTLLPLSYALLRTCGPSWRLKHTKEAGKQHPNCSWREESVRASRHWTNKFWKTWWGRCHSARARLHVQGHSSSCTKWACDQWVSIFMLCKYHGWMNNTWLFIRILILCQILVLTRYALVPAPSWPGLGADGWTISSDGWLDVIRAPPSKNGQDGTHRSAGPLLSRTLPDLWPRWGHRVFRDALCHGYPTASPTP